MLTQKHIQKILKKSGSEKTKLLKSILDSFRNAESVLKKKRKFTEEFPGKWQSAEEEIKDLLNEHIRRLEVENVELQAKMEKLMEGSEQINELKGKYAGLIDELEQTRVLAENAIKEKEETEIKLSKIQDQWQKLSSEIS